VRRLHGLLRASKEAEVERSLPRPAAAARNGGADLAPHEADLDAELDEAAEVGHAARSCAESWAPLAPQPGLWGVQRWPALPLPAPLPPTHPTHPCCAALAPLACAQEVKAAMREQFRAEDLAHFAIAANADFDAAVGGAAALKSGGIVAVKSADGKKRAAKAAAKPGQQQSGGKKHKGSGGGGERHHKKKKQ
jgi:hypothetical protein